MHGFLGKRSPSSSSEELSEELASDEVWSGNGSDGVPKGKKKQKLDIWSRIVRPDDKEETHNPEYSVQRDLLRYERSHLPVAGNRQTRQSQGLIHATHGL